MSFYYQRDNKAFGPVPGSVLRDLITSGVVIRSTLIRKDSGDWVAAGDVKALSTLWPESKGLLFYRKCGWVAFGVSSLMFIFSGAFGVRGSFAAVWILPVLCWVLICSFVVWCYGASKVSKIEQSGSDGPNLPNPYAVAGLIGLADLFLRVNSGIKRRSEERKVREREDELVDKLAKKLKS